MKIVLLLAFVCSALAEDEFNIEKTYVPEECSERSANGNVLNMMYKGSLASTGEVFDQSPAGSPFSFTLGAGQVIRGWDEGLLDMCVGEKRVLTIPASMGYGEAGSPPTIPGGATLKFEVELLSISDQPLDDNQDGAEGYDDTFKMLDHDSNGEVTKEELKQYLVKQEGDGLPQGDELSGLIDDIFKHEDKNKDGVIARDEFGKPHDEL